MDVPIKDTTDLLRFLASQAEAGNKQWFGFLQQKITCVNLAHQIATLHADKMTPDEVVEYVLALNNAIYNKVVSKNIGQ